jgi:DNA-binding MarR family transcriptional regulator
MSSAPTVLLDDELESAAASLPPRLTGLLGFQIRMAQATLYRDFAAAMGELNLTQRQMAVLEIVADSPGISQVDIAAQLLTDRATMMAIVDRLQDRDLLERRRSTEDRRRQEIFLTPTGLTLLSTARNIIAQHEKRFTDRFTAEELEVLLDALRRIQTTV